MTGRRLSHYQVAEEISRGGMGVVYRATDVRLQRDVALKVLPEDLMHDAERKRRFLQEAQAASALEHPNIAVIHDVDEADGQTFIAMELIRGEKLADVLGGQPLAVSRALELATEIASGLARAHEKGIVHRDLKPSNVMVSDDGHAKIIDFGIAKLIEPDQHQINAPTRTREDTAAGQVLGTTAYMSPEQTRAEKVDHRSDIFSFGIVLHEMLSGQPPFHGRSGIETASAILHQPAPRLTALGPAVMPDVGADLQRILDKCLAKEPIDRYQGMKDVIVDLRAARRKLESTNQPALAARPPRRWLTAAALAAVLAAAVAAVWLGRQPNEPSNAGPAGGVKKPAVAVLYFENASDTPELEWLRTGITEMVVTDLSQSPDIEVVATDQLYDVMASLKRSEDRVMSADVIRQVAERTGVSNVVVGSYLKSGNAIRINLRLQDASTGRIVSSERVEGQTEGSLFEMVDDLTRRLLTRFATLRADVQEGTDLLRRPGASPAATLDRGLVDVTTASIEAYRHYAEGIHLHDRNRELEATALFEQAIAIDPSFGMAYAKLAVTQGNLGNFAERDRYAALALQHANRLTPRERYYIEGYALSNSNDTVDRSMEAYQKCLEVDPGHHACRHNLALRLTQIERADDAIAHYEELIRRGTTNPTSFENLSRAYLQTGNTERARALLAEYIRVHADSALGHEAYAFALMFDGQLEESVAVSKRASILDPASPDPLVDSVSAYALMERWDLAAEQARALESRATPTDRWIGSQARRHVALYAGDTAEALGAAERAATAYRVPGQRSGLAHRNAAAVLLARGQHAMALAEAERALADSRNTPAEDGVRLLLVEIFAASNQPAEAARVIADLTRAAGKSPDKTQQRRILLAQGLLALSQREFEAAVAHLERARGLLTVRGPAPGGQAPHAQTLFALGQAYLAAGRHQQAAHVFQQVTELGYERWAWPVEYVRSFYFLGQASERIGDRAKARQAYRRFVGYWKGGDLDRSRVAEAEKKAATL